MAEGGAENQALKDEIRKCKVCKLKFINADSYIEHLESKEHYKGVMKEKYAKKYLEAKAKLDGKTENDETETLGEKQQLISDNPVSENNNTVENSEDEVFTCELCRKICTGLLNYTIHLNSQKHQKKKKSTELVKKINERNLIPLGEQSGLESFLTKTQFASTPIECKTCNTSCSGPESYKQHCNGEKHLKKLAMQGMLQEMKSQGIATKEISNDTVFRCEICQKAFSGPFPYQQHMESSAHMKQARNVQQLSKIKDLVICSEEDSKLWCKECRKVFSGPVPFNEHLRSTSHAKLKKNTAQMKALEKEHPEFMKIPLEESDNEDNEENDSLLLGCEICELVCTGPQSAREHFDSAKHKKAVKRKSMLEKLIKKKNEKKTGKISSAELSLEATAHEDDKSSDSEESFELLPET